MALEINPATYNPDNPISIYVGDLDRNCDYIRLENIFKQFYTTVVGAKIIKDPSTRMSKGYGFVMFASPEEADLAIDEMHGFQIMSRKIRTGKSMSKSGMAPIRGSGNGCGIMGNGLAPMPSKPPSMMGGMPSEKEKEAGMGNLPYPNMMMFNNLGYPVSYSQYYNFNMINMPYPYLQPGDQPEGVRPESANASDLTKTAVTERGMPRDAQEKMMAETNLGPFPHVGQSGAPMPSMEMMANPYYGQTYTGVYGGGQGFLTGQSQPQQGPKAESSSRRSSLLNKRSDEKFNKKNKKKVKVVPKGESVGEERKEEGTSGEDDLKVGGVCGWFAKQEKTLPHHPLS